MNIAFSLIIVITVFGFFCNWYFSLLVTFLPDFVSFAIQKAHKKLSSRIVHVPVCPHSLANISFVLLLVLWETNICFCKANSIVKYNKFDLRNSNNENSRIMPNKRGQKKKLWNQTQKYTNTKKNWAKKKYAGIWKRKTSQAVASETCAKTKLSSLHRAFYENRMAKPFPIYCAHCTRKKQNFQMTFIKMQRLVLHKQ